MKFLNACTHVSIIWTDDKIFIVELIYNSHKHQVLGRSIPEGVKSNVSIWNVDVGLILKGILH
uniref:Uncharacterized protein n=1 Tax=Lepeophtheirus salmonis TaxID=72036 RepID=A0A0K2UV79_LEPSM